MFFLYIFNYASRFFSRYLGVITSFHCRLINRKLFITGINIFFLWVLQSLTPPTFPCLYFLTSFSNIHSSPWNWLSYFEGLGSLNMTVAFRFANVGDFLPARSPHQRKCCNPSSACRGRRFMVRAGR